jgi:acetyl esterase/lipase
MRAQYALAAVAAAGAMIYGAADPVSSALTASSRSQQSSREATEAQNSARTAQLTSATVQDRGTSRSARVSSRSTTPKGHRQRSSSAQPAHLSATLGPAPAAAQAAGSDVTTPVAPSAAASAPEATAVLAEVASARDRHRAALLAAAAAPVNPAAGRTTSPAAAKPTQPAQTTTPAKTPQSTKTPQSANTQPSAKKKPPTKRTVAPTMSPQRAGRVVSTEEVYGPDREQHITISRLSTATGRQPVVYFVHGGSWIAGGRGEWAAEASRWARHGWTAVNIGYRLDVDGSLMLGDVRSAVSDIEGRPGVDPHRQILVGSSAGAHLASSIAVRYPSEFRGVVAWSPVVSPEQAALAGAQSRMGVKQRLASAARRLWGPNWRTATPVSYVTTKTPPLWAAASTGEWLKWSDQGQLICTALGSRCSSTLVPGDDHGVHLAASHPRLRQQALRWANREVA